MTVDVAALLGFASQAPGLIWTDAYEAAKNGVTVAQTGQYGVWVWAKDNEPSNVTLGEAQLSGAAAAKPSSA